MSAPDRHLRGLANAAGEAQRALEGRIAATDDKWGDAARRRFEGDHLGAIRSDARRLRVELAEAAAKAERAVRELREK